MLAEFLRANRADIIARTESTAVARTAPRRTDTEPHSGIPLFFDQLVDILDGSSAPTVDRAASATLHGSDLQRRGFNVSQVVHDYGGLCQAITQVADERNASISSHEFHVLNGCLDDAIAQAVTEFARQREQRSSKEGIESLGMLAHELRNHLAVALLAVQAIRSGSVGTSGSMGAMLDRSLKAMHALLDRSLAQVRLQVGLVEQERVVVAELIEELSISAAIEAQRRDLQFTIGPVDYEAAVEVDRPHLASALANLLQNAFKFTRPKSQVEIRTRQTADRVLIEIEDECGGLPPGKAAELFDSFAQGATDRSGLGLGLAISRRAVEESGGTLHVRDLPGTGCIFTVDLPKQPPLLP